MSNPMGLDLLKQKRYWVLMVMSPNDRKEAISII